MLVLLTPGCVVQSCGWLLGIEVWVGGVGVLCMCSNRCGCHSYGGMLGVSLAMVYCVFRGSVGIVA